MPVWLHNVAGCRALCIFLLLSSGVYVRPIVVMLAIYLVNFIIAVLPNVIARQWKIMTITAWKSKCGAFEAFFYSARSQRVVSVKWRNKSDKKWEVIRLRVCGRWFFARTRLTMAVRHKSCLILIRRVIRASKCHINILLYDSYGLTLCRMTPDDPIPIELCKPNNLTSAALHRLASISV